MANSLLGSLHRRLKLKNNHFKGCVYLRGDFDSTAFKLQENFVIDLNSSKYTHLGDVLFFLPIIIYLSSLKPLVIIASKHKSSLLSYFIVGSTNISYVNNYDAVDADFYIITQPYVIQEIPIDRVVLALGNPTSVPEIRYPMYLLKEFCDFLMLDYKSAVNIYTNYRDGISSSGSPKRNKRIFISPFIASGRFRDFFGFKKRAIIEYASIKHFKEGFDIFLLGSSDEKILLPFPFVDFRGLPIPEVIDIIRTGYFSMGVGFDNFWMHVSDIFNINYVVMFRGRFSKFGNLLHFKSVNVSFYKNMTRTYLTTVGLVNK
jgi:hypothetical protein